MRAIYIVCGRFLGCTSTGRVDLRFLWFYVQEHPKAQPAVNLVLKRLRRRGNSLKSHPKDWEKPGIEPAYSKPFIMRCVIMGLHCILK